MATDKTVAKSVPNAPAQAPAATVQPVRYAAGTGWELGQAAPSDKFIEVGPDGADVGKPTGTAPKGYGRQIAAKGATVTAAVRADLGLS